MTFLFFLWGFVTVLNDILIPQLKDGFDLSNTQAMLVQFCFFGAYFIVSPFAGKLVSFIGYKRGIVVGLVVMLIGCLLFYPAAGYEVYGLFLLALFVLASGITFLHVAANPYVIALGPEKTEASRINLAQAMNSLGTTLAPIFGVFIISDAIFVYAEAIQRPYLIIAATLLVVTIIFLKIKLPVISHLENNQEKSDVSIWSRKPLSLGVLAIFLYVGGEVSIGSFLIIYFSETVHIGLEQSSAGEMVAYYWGGAMIGRFIGAFLMKFLRPTRYLAFNALIAILLIIISMNSSGSIAMWSILLVGFFNSIMFPTIFALAIRGLGSLTSKGSAILCQAGVGGALVPLLQGITADNIGIQMSFIVPMIFYLYIGWYALNGAQANQENF